MKKKWKRFTTGVLAATLVFSNLNVVSAASTVNPNIALGAEATGENTEGYGNTYEKAVDGDYTTRLASSQNTKPVLQLDLGEEKTISFYKLFLEDRVPANPSNNVRKYRVTFSKNATFGDNDDATVERSLDNKTIRDDVLLTEAVQARYVKLEVLETHGASYDNAGITEFELYEKAFNEALGAKADGENTEGYGNTYDKAVDGDYTTRLASSQDTKAILTLDLNEEKNMQYFRLFLEERSVTSIKNNVAKYKIVISEDETFDEDDFTIERTLDNQTTFDEAVFDETVRGRYVKLEVLETHHDSWDNVGIREFELYDHSFATAEPATGPTVDEARPVYDAETNKIVVPSFEGWTIENNGADYEQIVDADFNVTKPLTEKQVKISLKKTNTKTGEVIVTEDYAVTIPGVYEESTGNQKPVVSPELAEWYSNSNDTFEVAANSRIVVNPDYVEELSVMAEEFKADYEDKLGRSIEIIPGSKADIAKGDFYFSLGSQDNMLGEEGYVMEITDKVTVEAVDKQGAYWATRTILQIMTQSEGKDTMPCGITRDYPKYPVRGFVLDVARKPCSMEMLEEIVKNMAWYKMNDFQVHLSDNYIFLEDYGVRDTEEEAFKAYDAFRLESSITNAEGKSPTAEDYAYTKAEFKDFIEDARTIGVDIVPEIDIPAHSNSFTKVFPEIMVKNQTSPTSSSRPLIDHIDISKPEAVAKVKEIFDDYTKGTEPTFDEDTIFHVGADEFLANYKAYREYLNEIIPYVKETNTVRMWGGLTWIRDNPPTQIIPEAIEGVQMNLWSKDWADGKEMYDMGYDLINTIDSYMYMVPNGGGGRGAYGDYLNTTNLFNNFETNVVSTSAGWKPLPSGDDQMLGAAFAIWNDNIDKRSSGLSEEDMFDRFYDALPVLAEKTWANGKEKGSLENLKAVSEAVGFAPNSNPHSQMEKSEGEYAKYTFANAETMKDGSDNGRDLTEVVNAEFVNSDASKAVQLNGGESYVGTPMEKLGYPAQITFDVKLDEVVPGQILFEEDSAYGTHDIRIMDGGKLGFTRELHEYALDYEIPAGEWVTVSIRTAKQSTSLYVNGELVGTATGKFIHNGMEKKTGITNATFTLPLERIGSASNAVSGLIDNIVITDGTDKSMISNEGITVEATSEYTPGNEVAANLLDGDPNTIWHSNWANASETLPQTLIFTFPEATEIERLSYLARQDASNNGTIMGFDLIAVDEDGNETMIAADHEWDGGKSLKFISFDAVTVKQLKMVIKKSNFDKAEQADKFASGAEINFYRPIEGSEEPDPEVVDKSVLEALIAEAETKELDGYTQESVNTLLRTLRVGHEVMDNADISQGMVDLTVNMIRAALNGLTEKPSQKKPADKTQIRAAVAEVEATDLSIYTDKSVEILMKALDAAYAVIADETLDEEDQAIVDRVKDTLLAAFNTLELKETPNVNKDALKQLIDKSVQFDSNEDLYTEESFAKFKTAYDEAVRVYQDEEATQEEVDEARNNLEVGRRELREKPNKDKLEELLAVIKSINFDKYPAKEAKAVKAAYAAAVAVFENEEVTQTQIDEAVTKLETAVKSLDEEILAGLDDDGKKVSAAEKTNTKTASGSGTTKPVKTGDSTNTSLWCMLMAIALSGVLAMKKRQK